MLFRCQRLLDQQGRACKRLAKALLLRQPFEHGQSEQALEDLRASIVYLRAQRNPEWTPLLRSLQALGRNLATLEDQLSSAHNPDAVVDQKDASLLDRSPRSFRDACGDAHVKAILATGELGTLRNVARASVVCMMAGADFIKTSTGKESVNATLPVSLVMIRAIREYHQRTGYRVGYKPAGGISKAKDALVYLSLIKEELGDRWLRSDLFRFGASSLLGDIERQLEHHVTGAYSAGYRHAVG